ncbi:hypothetical protein ABB37_02698 [Leptomonas pyrrhocoris]|uniref:Uncharacterized protein n=1 Tax=Leptomonas pyrrhocoris TaxID=157538 RepID=A0A0M9G5T9_LEPPY|nr:hypothetical protein ABB37_02698 [Leptomonas pyrrhocoris]KPA82953.1 hypothetical protein ABB37_02698 [Leptomonas pyrrhocoris]|eukprot:XP_015661392.1 hypothetical protein ABB37_02698 [Leptomonas pyrrhocoris]
MGSVHDLRASFFQVELPERDQESSVLTDPNSGSTAVRDAVSDGTLGLTGNRANPHVHRGRQSEVYGQRVHRERPSPSLNRRGDRQHRVRRHASSSQNGVQEDVDHRKRVSSFFLRE